MILSLRSHGVSQEVFVGEADAVFEFGFVGPAEGGGFADVQELARGAVGAGGVPEDPAGVADHLGDEFGQGLDGEFFAGAGVDGFVTGVVVHQEDAEVREVVHVQEFAERRAVAPAGHGFGAGQFGFVDAADEGREHVAVFGVVVVVGAVEVRWHYGDVVCSILPVQEFTVFEPADFSQRICLIGLFQLASQQATLLHRLGRHARVDATAPKELQLLASVFPGGVDDVHFQDHVVVHEVCQCALVRHDAAYFGGRQEHIFRFFFFKELFYVGLSCQV